MYKTIFIFLICCLATVCCNRQKSFDDKCRSDAQLETMRFCPREVSPGITYDSVVYTSKNKTITRYFTMVDSLYSSKAVDENKGKVRDALLKDIKNSITLKFQKEVGVSFSYIYSLKKSRKIILQFNFLPKDYL